MADPAPAPAPAATSDVNGPGTGSVIPTVEGANKNAALQAPGTMGGGQAVIATSGSSRAQTTSNVNTLQTALNNVPPPPNTGGGTGTPTDTTKTNTQPNNSNPAPTTTGYKYDPKGNIVDGQGSLVAGKDSAGGYSSVSNGSGQVLTGLDAQGNLLFGPAPTGGAAGSGPAPAGGSTAPASGSTGIDNTSAVAGLPTNLQGIAKANLDNIDQQYAQAQANVASAAATLANDPALASAITTIQAQYKTLYEAMALKNQQLLGRANSEVGAFGGLGVMSQSFLSNEMDQAQTRLSDIIAKEQSAIIAAKAAYQKGDVAALNAATTQLKDAQSAKSTAVSQLLTASNNAVKDAQAQAKIDLTTQQDTLKSDVTNSTNLGASIATDLAAAGITDLAEIKQYIDQMAAANNLPPAFVEAAYTKAAQTATKATASAANTADTIANRDARTTIAAQKKATTGAKPGVDAGYSYTAADIAKYSSVLEKGATLADGTVIAGRGSDGYVDPGAYTAALSSWTSKGGTPAGFAKKFPVKTNVNPASYGQLPASLQPKTAAPPAAVPQ